MKLRQLSWILCSLLGSSTVHAASLSFEQAWSILQQSNHSLAAERANVDHFQHLQNATGHLNYPAISLDSTYARIATRDITLPIPDSAHQHPTASTIINTINPIHLSDRSAYSSSIRAIWPIFTGGRITAAQTAAKGKRQEAESQFAMVVQARYEDLAKYYYSVVLAHEVLQTHIAVEQGLTKHRDNALKLEQQGQIALVERLQAEASLDKAIIERKKSEKTLEIAQSALTQILNQTQPVRPSGSLFINPSLPPLDAFIEQTLATYPGLDLLGAKETQAQSLIKAEKGKYYPEVYLFGHYSLYEDDSLLNQLNPDWMVGVGVSIPLLENTGRSHQVKAANSLVSQVQSLRAQAEQDLTVLVEKTYKEAEQALEEAQGLNSSLRLAQENLSLRQKAFNQGLSTSLDVVDAELYLASIRTQQAVAGFNYLISLSKLLAVSSEMDAFAQYQYRAVPLTMLPNNIDF